MQDFTINVDGASEWLWEPIWQLEIKLSSVELELLRSPAIRRLHRIHHCGPIYYNSSLTYSRLQHTLGVFATVAHFQPEERELRVAALLHDIGHVPFSHTLERIDGIDHHHYTIAHIESSEITEILLRHGLEPSVILQYITGDIKSVLRNKDNTLQLDHLDSWVRSAFHSGRLPTSPREILKDIEICDGVMYTGLETAHLFKRLIIEEARMHCSPANITANALIKSLVEMLISNKELSISELPIMTDSMVEHRLLSSESTKETFSRFMNDSWSLKVTRDVDNLPEEYLEWTIKKLYLSTPLTKHSDHAIFYKEVNRDFLQIEEELKGLYFTYWAYNR